MGTNAVAHITAQRTVVHKWAKSICDQAQIDARAARATGDAAALADAHARNKYYTKLRMQPGVYGQMSGTSWHVLCVIAKHANEAPGNKGTKARPGGTGICWPSQELIAIEAGESERGVQRGVTELREGGFITTRQRMNQSSVYTLNLKQGINLSVPFDGKGIEAYDGTDQHPAGMITAWQAQQLAAVEDADEAGEDTDREDEQVSPAAAAREVARAHQAAAAGESAFSVGWDSQEARVA